MKHLVSHYLSAPRPTSRHPTRVASPESPARLLPLTNSEFISRADVERARGNLQKFLVDLEKLQATERTAEDIGTQAILYASATMADSVLADLLGVRDSYPQPAQP